MNKFVSTRINRTLASLVVLAGTLFVSQSASAQILSHGDLFGPGAPSPMIGIELGFGSHQQQGTYNAACGCTFGSGTGTGFLGNLVFELPVDYEWTFGMKAGIDFKKTQSTQPIVDSAIIQYADQSQPDTISGIRLNRIGDVKATYFTLSPFVQYQFFRMGPFVQAGPGIGFLVANHFTHHRQLVSDDAQLANNQVIHNVRFNSTGTREETVEDQGITDVSSLRLSVLLSAGYNLAVSERSVFTPMLSYDFPLTVMRSSSASNWKLASLYGSVVLKFKLD